MRSMRGQLRVLVVAAVAMACAGGPRALPGHPLYPGEQRPQAQVSNLQGPIAAVDGQSVAGLGRSFHLLPGCHLVTTESNVVEGDQNMTLRGSARPLTYAMLMRPGHVYVVERQYVEAGLNLYRLVTRAYEVDSAGSRTRTFDPSPGQTLTQDCAGQ
jgi:hypothetical protein